MKSPRYSHGSFAAALTAVATLSGCLTTLSSQPPVEIIRSSYKPGELSQLCHSAIHEAKRKYDAIAKLPAEKRNFDNTMLAYESAFAEMLDQTNPLTFMYFVTPDKKVHDESVECETQVNQFAIQTSLRKDLYLAIKDAQPRNDAEKRLFTESMKGFKKNGLSLPDEKLVELTTLKKELAALETKFNDNLNKDSSEVKFTKEELSGVPDSILERLQKTDNGLYRVTTKPTDYRQVLQNAEKSETRKRLSRAYNNRGGEANLKLLEQGVQLRQKIASLLGYKSWADHQIDGRMAKDAATALGFLNGLRDRLAERNRKDLDKLLEFKQELDPTATQLDAWDLTYLDYQLKKKNYSLDDEEIRNYFPADTVLSKVFEIYSQLLGVSFVKVQNVKAWANDVQLYEIRESKSGELIAHFYTDFIPREDKYEHFAAFSLIMGRNTLKGYSKPVSAIVGNFNPATDKKPSLLSHDEVNTLFHEFGHIMHQTLTKAPYASFSGSSVARDFVEAPSQMLENWTWNPEMLSLLSSDYRDPSKKLPAQLLEKMIEAKDFNQGYFYTRQLLYGLFDLTIHSTPGKVDVNETYRRLHRELVGLPTVDGDKFPAGFGHMMGGYDGGYYGYLWSDVYAADMFTRFAEGGLLNPEVGSSYRRTILEQGGMVEALDLVTAFLGRAPNADAFYRQLGLDPRK